MAVGDWDPRSLTVAYWGAAPSLFQGWEPTYSKPTKAELLRELSLMAYRAASTPTEAKMAGILCDLFVPEHKGDW